MAKAITKLEHRVWDLSDKLPALTEKQIEYGQENSFWRYFDTSYNFICCLECGHKWRGSFKNYRHKCPECNHTLRQFPDHKTWMRAQGYMMVMDKVEEFQVLRYLYVNKWMKKGEPARYDSREISQVFIRPDGKVTIMGASRNPLSAYYSPQWSYNETLSIKRHNNRFYQNHYTEHYSCLYPSKKIIPELKRNGFKTSFYGQIPTEMIQALLTNSMLETLLKRGNKKLFQQGVKYYDTIADYWEELKITFRNNYEIADYGIWKDYIDFLRYYKKDTLNSKFTCPKDLSAAHNKWMQKKQRDIKRANRLKEEQRIAEQKKKLEDWRIKYPEMRKAFLNFCVKHENITIETIKSVDQLEEESKFLTHCGFVKAYYSKENSLLLSARVNDIVVETIEINLTRMEITQARGYDNEASKYNKQIVQLMEKNLPKIHKLHKKQLKMTG
jgi:hypothetical protein